MMKTCKELIRFVKMHGAGNDYIYINALDHCPSDLPALAIEISDRHFGIGSDGLVAILPSEIADFKMQMYNADGSRAQMCGNASRCIAKFVRHFGLSDKNPITLETDAGIKILCLNFNPSGEMETVTVDMGAPITVPSEIPVISDHNGEGGLSHVILRASDGTEFDASAVSMGNPHGVIFIKDSEITDRHILIYGKEFETNSAFPEKANIEFAHVVSPSEVNMRVWERGSGETLACGTGACATAVAGIFSGILAKKVRINLLGGSLEIEWREDTGHIMMTGPAEIIAEGTYYRKGNIKNIES